MNRARNYLAIKFLFFIIMGSLLHTDVLADDAVIGRTPAGVYPMMDAVAEMVSEEIVIDLDRNTVECTFEFQNTGAARDVLMGFPGKLREDLGSSFSDDASLSLDNFKTFVNGEELPVKRENGVQPEITMPDYSEWFTFTVPFKEGEKVIVRNTYDYMPSYNSIGDVTTGYVLQTGSTWKGNIGKARVEFKLGSIEPWQVEKLKPGGFRFEGNSIVWERDNIEPAYDLQLVYNTWLYSEDYLAMMEANDEDAGDILLKIEKYQDIQQLAAEKDEESLLTEYGKAAENRDPVLTAYIEGFLPNTQIPDDAPTLGEINIIPYGTAYHISCDVKSLYSPDVMLRITHKEAENVVIDSEVKKASTYIILKPEFEYDISIAVKDWLDRTATKAVKFEVPAEESEQEENSDRAETAETVKTSEAGYTDNSDTSEETGTINEIGTTNNDSDTNNGTGTVKETDNLKGSEGSEGSNGTDNLNEINGNDKTNEAGVTNGTVAANETTLDSGSNGTGVMDESGGIGKESQPDGTGETSRTNAGLQSGGTSKNSVPATDGPLTENNNKTLLWILAAVVALGCMAAGFFSFIKSKA